MERTTKAPWELDYQSFPVVSCEGQPKMVVLCLITIPKKHQLAYQNTKEEIKLE